MVQLPVWTAGRCRNSTSTRPVMDRFEFEACHADAAYYTQYTLLEDGTI